MVIPYNGYMTNKWNLNKFILWVIPYNGYMTNKWNLNNLKIFHFILW